MIRILMSSILSLILLTASASLAADNSALVTCATSPSKCLVIKNPSVVIGKTTYTVALAVRDSYSSWEEEQTLSNFMKEYCLGYNGTFAGYKVEKIKNETKIVVLGSTLNFSVKEKSSVLYSAVTRIVCIKKN